MSHPFQFKTQPLEKQLVGFNLSKDKEEFALLMEMGTGKTKILIDTGAYLWSIGRINAMLVIAPNGVHLNWTRNEIPKHLPDWVPRYVAEWVATPSAAQRKRLEGIVALRDGITILAMNVEALATKRGQEFAMTFVNSFNALMVVDESTVIKNPELKRSQFITTLGRRCPYRRIANGTPITQAPFDAFGQFYFLSPHILHTTSYYAFKAHYAEMIENKDSGIMRHIQQRREIAGREKARLAGKEFDPGKMKMPQVVARTPSGRPKYRNLKELQETILPYSYRVLKKDCLDLPEKTYSKLMFEMRPEQRRAYESMRDKARAVFADQFASAVNKLEQLSHLSRITSGFMPDDTNGLQLMYPDPNDNPRIRALLDMLETMDEDTQVIIWCKYVDEIKLLHQLLPSSVMFYGEVKPNDRIRVLNEFESGQVKYFIGQVASGGVGLNLVAASVVIYFSNTFSLYHRLQSEDRAHRMGQTKAVTYYDVEAVDSVDQKIIDTLRAKKEVADLVTGDSPIDWI